MDVSDIPKGSSVTSLKMTERLVAHNKEDSYGDTKEVVEYKIRFTLGA